MEVKQLQIEIVLAEMLAERNKIILQQNDALVTAQKELEETKVVNSKLQDQLKALASKE